MFLLWSRGSGMTAVMPRRRSSERIALEEVSDAKATNRCGARAHQPAAGASREAGCGGRCGGRGSVHGCRHFERHRQQDAYPAPLPRLLSYSGSCFPSETYRGATTKRRVRAASSRSSPLLAQRSAPSRSVSSRTFAEKQGNREPTGGFEPLTCSVTLRVPKSAYARTRLRAAGPTKV